MTHYIFYPRWTARLKIGNNTRFLRDYPSTPCALGSISGVELWIRAGLAGVNLAAI
jgi:hypothetical protein